MIITVTKENLKSINRYLRTNLRASNGFMTKTHDWVYFEKVVKRYEQLDFKKYPKHTLLVNDTIITEEGIDFILGSSHSGNDNYHYINIGDVIIEKKNGLVVINDRKDKTVAWRLKFNKEKK